jgi:hypothetical protein
VGHLPHTKHFIVTRERNFASFLLRKTSPSKQVILLYMKPIKQAPPPDITELIALCREKSVAKVIR